MPPARVRHDEIIIDVCELAGTERGVILVGEAVDAVKIAIIPKSPGRRLIGLQMNGAVAEKARRNGEAVAAVCPRGERERNKESERR